MRCRKGIELDEATEEELLRYQMVNIVKTSRDDVDSLGECSDALAKIYNSLKYRHIRFFLGFLLGLYLIVGFFILIKKFFLGKEKINPGAVNTTRLRHVQFLT